MLHLTVGVGVLGGDSRFPLGRERGIVTVLVFLMQLAVGPARGFTAVKLVLLQKMSAPYLA